MAIRTVSLAVVLVVLAYTRADTLQECAGKEADIVLIIDESSSIWPPHFKNMTRYFLQNLAGRFDIRPDHTRMAAVTFSDNVEHRFSLSDYENAEDVQSAIGRITQRTGNTRTDKALEYVRNTILAEARAKVPKIVLLITDGGSDKTEITKSQAQLLRDQRNATIFVVAISNKINMDEIESVASKPTESHVFQLDSFDDLTDSLVEQLVHSACMKDEECTSAVTDVVFVLGSASQNMIGAMQTLDLVQEIISDNNTLVSATDVRFGLVCDIDLGFDLNTYFDKPAILDHLQNKKSRMTAADHIDYMTKFSFNNHNGDRPDVRNLGVVILDEASEDPSATIAAAQRAKDAGIEILAVSIGKRVSDMEITSIASQPAEEYKITLSDFSEPEVASLKKRYVEVICSKAAAPTEGVNKRFDARELLEYLMRRQQPQDIEETTWNGLP